MAEQRRRKRNYEEKPEITYETVVQEIAEKTEDDLATVIETEVDVEIANEPVEDFRTKVLPNKCIVNVPRLNLRMEPSTESNILGVLNMGEILSITDETDEFYAVTTEINNSGYVKKECVQI